MDNFYLFFNQKIKEKEGQKRDTNNNVFLFILNHINLWAVVEGSK